MLIRVLQVKPASIAETNILPFLGLGAKGSSGTWTQKKVFNAEIAEYAEE
jgi:hypothetical protein